MANKIKYSSGIDANALNIGNWKVGSEQGMGPTVTTGYKHGMQIPEGGYSIYSDNITARTAANDSELINIINKLSKEKAGWFTLYALTYPESTQTPASRDGITPGFDNITGSKLYNASRDLNYYVFDEDNNTWVPDSYFNGERIDGHCYDTYDGQPNQHATFHADYDNIKATFPNATHIVIGSHAAENNDNNSSTLARLQELGLPADHIGTSRPEYILVGKPNRPELTMYVRENVSSNVAHLNVQLPLEDVASNTYEALTWAKNNNVLVLNKPVDDSVKSGLKLYLDASNTASYPKAGSLFYDLSGNNNTFTLESSGITYNSKGYLDLSDGGAYINSNITSSSTGTLVFLMSTTDSQSLFWSSQANGGSYVAAYRSGNKEYYSGAGSPVFYLDTVDTPNVYDNIRDGKWHMVEFKNVNLSGWTGNHFNNYGGYTFSNTKVASIKLYDRSLSQAESLQNYYGADIVTDGLVFAVDPANLISNERGSSDVYDLTKNTQLGTLLNGATSDGNWFIFDGNDDELAFPHNSVYKNQEITVDFWVNLDKESGGRHVMFTSWYGFTVEVNNTQTVGYLTWGLYGLPGQYMGGPTITYNKPTNITCTYNPSTNIQNIFIDGELKASQVVDGTVNYNSSELRFSGSWDRTKGKMSFMKIYNKELSQDEVLQNYNATAARFK